MIDTNMAVDHKGSSDDDARWIGMILEGGRQENIAIKEIYDRYSKMVINYIRQNKGHREDGEDILQEAIPVLALKVHNGNFRGESSLKNFLMAIARNMWINQLRKEGHHQKYVEAMEAEELRDISIAITMPKELELLRNGKLRALLRAMSKLFKGCMPILKMYYWYEWQHKKIAELLQYPSEASVKVKKMRCMEELKRYIEQHPSLKLFLREG